MTEQPAAPANPDQKNSLEVFPIPAFSDNYLWLIHNGTYAAVVDPGDAAPVLAALKTHGLTLAAILLTHHHADHVGGVVELTKQAVSGEFPAIPVYGPAHEKITGMTQTLQEGDRVELPALGLQLSVLDVPGHTSGHIAYVSHQQDTSDWLFCGDTLFAGGCGRLFEGTPAQMVESLAKLASLPADTLVFCAHEYTLSNLRFAMAVDADNPALVTRVKNETAKRERGQPTIPSTMLLERQTNPFLRHTETAIVRSLQNAGRLATNDPIKAFAALREWKNTYK
jgi:hydroxyacylglutathione hydrolase